MNAEQAKHKQAQDRAIACIGQAMGHLEARRLKDAELALKEALEHNPTHPQIHFLFAELCLARGDRAGAVGHASRALGWERKRPEPYVMLAKLLHLEGNSPLAARLLDRALTLAPGDQGAQQALQGIAQAPQATKEHPELEHLGRRPTIGLAMIVKNEALSLGRCLRSAKAHVDEMIVVDTGSTDATVAIAQMEGAKVLPYTWTHDFAAARNFAIESATTDWVLVLDADEELEIPPGHLHQLVENLPWPTLTGVVPLVWVKLYNHAGSVIDRDPWEAMPIARLFPRDHIRYKGAAHETPELAPGSPHELKAFQAFTVELHHHGYRPEMLKGRDKLTRNIELMHKRIEADPADTDVFYLLGRELVFAERYEEGLEALKRYADHAIAQDKKAVLFRLTPFLQALALDKLGREDEALAALNWGLSIDPDFPTYHYFKAEILTSRKQYDEAIRGYNRALANANYHEVHGLANYNAIVPGHAGSLAIMRRDRAAALAMGIDPAKEAKLPPAQEAIRLGLEALGEGRLDEVARQLQVATRLAPTHSQVPYLQAELALREGRIPEAIQMAFASLQLGPNVAEVWALMGYLLHVDEDSELAAVFLRQAIAMSPDYLVAKELLRQVTAGPRKRFAHPELVAWLQSLQAAQQPAPAGR